MKLMAALNFASTVGLSGLIVRALFRMFVQGQDGGLGLTFALCVVFALATSTFLFLRIYWGEGPKWRARTHP